MANKLVAEGWDILKKNLWIIPVIIIFIWWNGGCGGRNNGINTSDTTRYTVQQPQPIIIMPPYQPQQQGNTVFPINIPSQYNASTDITKLTEQYNRLLNEFLALRTYNDSIQLKDSAGNRVGVVNLKQMVSENILKSTQPSYQLSFPHTYTTITNTIYPPIKNQVFMGVTVQSPINSPKFGEVDLGLIFKNKKENLLSLSGTYNVPNKQVGIRVGYYQKISFKNPLKQLLPVVR